MKQTSIVGLGIVGFVILAILTIVLAGRWIEDDLTERSVDSLQAAGLNWAKVELDGRDATLTGEVPDAAAAQEAVETVGNVWGVRVVNDETTKP